MEKKMNNYLIGTLCGGLMECPGMSFSGPYYIISAYTHEQAIKCYNKVTNASYFYGSVMATLPNDSWSDISIVSDYCSKHDIREAIASARQNNHIIDGYE